MELLITGSTGFVGRNLLLKILREYPERWSRIILPVRDPEKLRSQLRSERCDGPEMGEKLLICRVSDDAWNLPSGVRPDLVIHAAGRLFGRERGEYFQTNVKGSLALAGQLPKSARMIVLSSLAAGGPTPEGVEARTRKDPDTPVSFYGASKLAMEQGLGDLLAGRLLILRPPMVLGPRDTATMPLFQMAKGWLRVKPGLKKKNYSWIAVEDLCEAILNTAGAAWPQQGPFYLTATETISDAGLLATAGSVQGRRGMAVPVPHCCIQMLSLLLDAIPPWRNAVPSLGRDRVREILPDRWVCDGTPFVECFAWKPSKGLTETLRESVEWLNTQKS